MSTLRNQRIITHRFSSNRITDLKLSCRYFNHLRKFIFPFPNKQFCFDLKKRLNKISGKRNRFISNHVQSSWIHISRYVTSPRARFISPS